VGSSRLFKLMFDETRKPGMGHDILLRRLQRLIDEAARETPAPLLDSLRPRELALGWLALVVGAVALHRAGLHDEEKLRATCARCAGRVLGFPFD
jgi:hypothetical protein